MATFYRLNPEIGNKVLDLFKNKCLVCGSKNDLCVHHVVKIDIKDPEYNNIENLIVLCRKCHMSHHRKNRDVCPPEETLIKQGCVLNPGGRRGKYPPIKCKENNCDRLQYGHGYCKKHYTRMIRHGLSFQA